MTKISAPQPFVRLIKRFSFSTFFWRCACFVQAGLTLIPNGRCTENTVSPAAWIAASAPS